jgi:hypothetical protein
VDSCPNGALFDCGPFHVYYKANEDSGWQHFSRTLSPGGGLEAGSALVADGNAALVSTSGRLFSATPNGTLVEADPSCQPIGALTPGQLIGLCGVGGVGGGGDASVASFAVSTDQGRDWVHFVRGPPSDGWSGATTTNGNGVLFYVTGGTTLWRVDTTNRTWAPVLQTPAHTTDELYPVYFAGANVGFVGESGSTGVQLFETRDGGLTWSPTPSL